MRRPRVRPHSHANVCVAGLNLVGRSRELSSHSSYQQQQQQQQQSGGGYTTMECDPSPSRHPHRQRYHQAPMISYGPTSLQYAPYPGPMTDGSAPKHNSSTTANGPQQAKQSDRDDSPMVGVCVQHNSVAIHWTTRTRGFCFFEQYVVIIRFSYGVRRKKERDSSELWLLVLFLVNFRFNEILLAIFTVMMCDLRASVDSGTFEDERTTDLGHWRSVVTRGSPIECFCSVADREAREGHEIY